MFAVCAVCPVCDVWFSAGGVGLGLGTSAYIKTDNYFPHKRHGYEIQEET